MSIQQFITDVVNQNIVRSSNKIGVGGFVFDVVEAEDISFSSNVTDHYVEENISIQDHIAIKPKVVTLKGCVGELKDTQDQVLFNAFIKIENLASVGGLKPEYSAQVTQAYQKINDVVGRVKNVVNQANSIFDLFFDKTSASDNQQRAYAFFKQLWESRELCTVDTPYETFQNMAIMDVRVLQRNESKMISDFSVSLKEIRTAETTTIPAPIASGRVANAISKNVAVGKVVGKKQSIEKIVNVYPGN